jgi:hypothetical protein
MARRKSMEKLLPYDPKEVKFDSLAGKTISEAEAYADVDTHNPYLMLRFTDGTYFYIGFGTQPTIESACHDRSDAKVGERPVKMYI